MEKAVSYRNISCLSAQNVLFYEQEQTLWEGGTDFIGHRYSHSASQKQINPFYGAMYDATAYYSANI